MRFIRRTVGIAGTATVLALSGVPVFSEAVPAQTTTTVLVATKSGSVESGPSSPRVKRVALTVGSGTGAARSYTATVLDAENKPIPGATLDIGGLGANPDVRVKTTKMVARPDNPTAYTATIEYPSDGDFVLVVRVHTPSSAVELFTERIDGVGAGPDHGDLTPSRAAVLKADPTFYKRYDPMVANSGGAGGAALSNNVAGSGTDGHGTSAHAHPSQNVFVGSNGDGIGTTSTHAFDPNKVLTNILHSAGAAAWILAVLGLVFANRLGPGVARSALTELVSRNYALLAGLGLLTVTLTGASKTFTSSAGLTNPIGLLQSSVGTAYLAVFAFKICLALGSIALSWKIGQLLPTGHQIRAQRTLLSVGAHANTDLSAFGQSIRAYRLAETNAMLGGLIVVCVAVLEQLHFALH